MAPRPPSAPSTRSSQRVEFRVVAGSAPLIGANLHTNLTLRSGPQGRVSKGGQQSRCCEPAFSTISCVAHPSRRPLCGLLRMRLLLGISSKLAPMSAPLQWRSYFGMRLMHSATSCNPSAAAAAVRKMTSNVFSRIIAAIGDSFRITKAFDMAARGEYEKALNVLNRLGQDTRHLYGARLLRGALYSHLAMHERAVIELASAAQTVKADKRFSKAESN
jgi:hypothetical protein